MIAIPLGSQDEMMPYDFDPSKPKGSRYLGSWQETPCRSVGLPFSEESLRTVLEWGANPDSAPYTHQEIAHWCDRLHMECFDSDHTLPDCVISIACDVDCQWDLYLANSYQLDELRHLDFALVRMPTTWFVEWLGALPAAPKRE